MPQRVFPYYFDAYVSYLLSPMSVGASSEASGFIGLTQYRVNYYPELVRSLWPKISEALAHVARSQEFYGATNGFEGSFPDRCNAVFRLAEHKLGLLPQ